MTKKEVLTLALRQHAEAERTNKARWFERFERALSGKECLEILEALAEAPLADDVAFDGRRYHLRLSIGDRSVYVYHNEKSVLPIEFVTYHDQVWEHTLHSKCRDSMLKQLGRIVATAKAG